MKKLGKLLIFGAAIGSAAAATYYYLAKRDANLPLAEEDEDFDDFDEDIFEDESEDKEDDAEFDDDFFEEDDEEDVSNTYQERPFLLQSDSLVFCF